jgi:allophanate hydrolase
VPTEPLRVGVPAELAAIPAATATLAATGAVLREVDLAPFIAAGDLLYGGAFVAERYEAVGAFVDAHRGEVHPVVGEIIAAAARLPAWQLFRDQTELARLRALTLPAWDDIDVLVVPSVPRVPTVAEVMAAPLAVNSMLGTYTNFVNLLDLCALTVPVGRSAPAGPPPSITLIAPAWSDDVLVSLAGALPDRPASLRTR